MSTPTWQAGTLYQPGALVQRVSAPPTGQDPPTNGNFEAGDSGWTMTTGWSISNAPSDPPFDGSYCAEWSGDIIGLGSITNNNKVPVLPGQVITALGYINTTGDNNNDDLGAAIGITWYNAADSIISQDDGIVIQTTHDGWNLGGVTATAPALAAKAAVHVNAFRNDHAYGLQVDTVSWDYTYATPPDGLIFRAVQANAATSAATEPVWPTTNGDTVVDGGVTWEAVIGSRVIWEASTILVSGSTEPTWPIYVGGHVADNTISWQAVTGQIADAKCPNTVPVAIAASKIFAGDRDIISFSATVNPLDWSTANDAGYLPFGLQSYGGTPVTALGLYRGNLVAFNSQSFQMWQVDQDPANMALLDAVPVGCIYPRSVQPLNNDLLFLSKVGVRNVSIAGASTNLQAGGVGQPIDPMIIASLKTATTQPISLYYPAQGQYWLIFGAQAYVLTVTGASSRSWSRYTFPSAITDWTLMGDDLYLRSGVKIWKMDPDAVADDVSSGTLALADPQQPGVPDLVLTAAAAALSPPSTIHLTLTGTSDIPPGGTHIIGLDALGAPISEIVVIALPGEFTSVNTYASISRIWTENTGYTGYLLSADYANETSTAFNGLVQWPHLDLGALGREKQLIGFDIVSDAPTGVSVSIGYNQNNLAQRTTPYAIDADTLPGMLVPLPVSGPSFDMQLTFQPGQIWEFEAANLYIQDWRVTS